MTRYNFEAESSAMKAMQPSKATFASKGKATREHAPVSLFHEPWEHPASKAAHDASWTAHGWSELLGGEHIEDPGEYFEPAMHSHRKAAKAHRNAYAIHAKLAELQKGPNGNPRKQHRHELMSELHLRDAHVHANHARELADTLRS